ncbi:MAG: MmpS family transport accessory protein [Mycobacterium sp.]
MSKPYWSGAGGRSGSSYLDDLDDAAAPRSTTAPRTNGYSSVDSGTGFYSGGGYRTTDEYRDSSTYDDEYDEDYDYYEGPDTRWRWLAGLAVAVLLAAALAITLVMRSDNTSPTAQTEAAPPATSTAPRTVIATVPPSPAPPPTAQLSPETVVTVTTAPSATAVPSPVPPVPAPLVPPAAAPAPPDPRTITYTVTGTRQLIDLVTIIYTDEQGMPRTEVNAALPWSRTVVLNPGVDFQSVTATSITGQLNCAITDAAGATLIAQTNNSMIATCTN